MTDGATAELLELAIAVHPSSDGLQTGPVLLDVEPVDLIPVLGYGEHPLNLKNMQDNKFSYQYRIAKRYFDAGELQKCSHILRETQDDTEKWLGLYSRFLHAGSGRDTGACMLSPKEARSLLNAIGGSKDAYLLYLRALVLAEMKERRAAIACLVESLQGCEYNWSAWLRLADLLDGEEELLSVRNDVPNCLLARFFHVHATLEVHRASDALREDIVDLQRIFPQSFHLQAQHALLEYHLRDFDLAERLFDELRTQDPYRLDELDTYSNILYVMGKGGKLAQVAQMYSEVNRDRPEVCCLVGNLYSLRGDHAKAIAMFRQALKLDRGYLTAWTLMGHEYVEMSNTHAAIESYRKACQANRKDYRAWYGLGQAYELLGMHAYALQYFQKATALRPFDSRMWQALAQIYGKLAKPHEVLKCYKRAQLFVEPDDLTNLRKLGDHCLSMGLLEESAKYWHRLIMLASEQGVPLQDVAQIYLYLAAYEMGEHHVAQRQHRNIGDLGLAELYLSTVSSLNNEDADTAKQLHHKLRELQLA